VNWGWGQSLVLEVYKGFDPLLKKINVMGIVLTFLEVALTLEGFDKNDKNKGFDPNEKFLILGGFDPRE